MITSLADIISIATALTSLADIISIATALAFASERLVEYLVVPVFEKFNLDKFWVKYIVLIVGGLLSYFAGVDFFEGIFQIPLVGIILSALFVGGGSELVHQLIGALNRTNRE